MTQLDNRACNAFDDLTTTLSELQDVINTGEATIPAETHTELTALLDEATRAHGRALKATTKQVRDVTQDRDAGLERIERLKARLDAHRQHD